MTAYQEHVDETWATSQELNDRYVIPAISKFLNAQVISINKHASSLEAMLDRRAGLDAVACFGGQVHGLGLRASHGTYNNFTIRWRRSTGLATEFQKHKAHTGLKPTITVQAYLDGSILSLGVAVTSKLYKFAEDNLHDEWAVQRKTNYDGGRFLSIRWHHLENMSWFRRFETNVALQEDNASE
ncbi:MAG TPA: hypothetical protein VGN72_00305 [Tepidisphaeraceae bacterium]|jgi:hypothetical protein|nr:hypothetical protein [Tepidisphaeraceae bacterium]